MKIFPIILLTLVSFSLFAQDRQGPVVQDPAAQPFLDNLANLFSDQTPFQVEFKYEIISKVNDAKVSDYGSVIVKGKKYKMKTEDTEVYFNGTRLWSYNVPAGEVYVSLPDSGDAGQTLTDPFTLLGNYKKYYKYRYMGEKTIDGKTYDEIELYPINLDTNYSILKLLVYDKGKSIYSFTVQQKNGIDIIIYVTDVIRNLKISDSTFQWDEAEHPDVLVIEM